MAGTEWTGGGTAAGSAQLARLLAPQVLSPQETSSRRFVDVDMLVALSALLAVDTSSQCGGIAGSAAIGCSGSRIGITDGSSATAGKLLAA